jgi:hypothetical protein
MCCTPPRLTHHLTPAWPLTCIRPQTGTATQVRRQGRSTLSRCRKGAEREEGLLLCNTRPTPKSSSAGQREQGSEREQEQPNTQHPGLATDKRHQPGNERAGSSCARACSCGVDDAGRGTAARPVLAGGAVAFGDVGRAVRGEPAAGAGEGIRRHAPERSRRGPGANRAAHQGGRSPCGARGPRVGPRRSAPETLRAGVRRGRSHRPLQQHRRHLTAVTVRRGRTGSRSSVRVITTDALASAQRGHAETTTALTVANKCPPVS